MKTKLLVVALGFILLATTKAQDGTDSWNVGFGFTYPRLMSINPASNSLENNYGGFLSIQRKFSENIGLRLRSNYSNMKSDYRSATGQLQNHNVDLFSINLDLSYHFLPNSFSSPYALIGIGAILFTPENSPKPSYDDTFSSFQLNLGLGAEWVLSKEWELKTEFLYHTPSTNDIDGINDELTDKGLLGGSADTYMGFDVGLKYYFARNEPKPEPPAPVGIIEKEPEIKYVTKEVIVEKPITIIEKEWVLVGVNFDFDKSTIKFESKPILYSAVEFLKEHPNLDVVIEGHTDIRGSDKYNQELSEARAESVKAFLVKQGIDTKRLSTQGYGKSKPITDKNTKEGHYLNRRIVFKLIKK
ncbi:MAG: OmpA family protein [Melioribacteraceae bacterium]|nr:OmpA family protein [Melioribacteraceae bacterium]